MVFALKANATNYRHILAQKGKKLRDVKGDEAA